MVQHVELHDFCLCTKSPFHGSRGEECRVVLLVIGPFEQMYAKKLLESAENVWIYAWIYLCCNNNNNKILSQFHRMRQPIQTAGL